MPFLANIKQLGAMKYRDVLGSIGFLEPSNNAMPIGQIEPASTVYRSWEGISGKGYGLSRE